MYQHLLTKSRYKLALDCPYKLFYTRKAEYANSQMEDPFLQALAQGGFQVEELARLEYPDGILIEGNDWKYDLLASQTNELLQQENVVIFEATFKFENLFIRTDILIKHGERIQFIEVKARSFDPEEENLLVGKKGGLVAGWITYLFDVAFLFDCCSNYWPFYLDAVPTECREPLKINVYFNRFARYPCPI